MRFFLFAALASLLARLLLVAADANAHWQAAAVYSDIALALLLACLGQWLLKLHRAALAALALCFAALLVANMEMITALNRSIDLRDYRYAMDPMFLAASTARLSFPAFTALVVAGALWSAWRQRILPIGRKQLLIATGLCILLPALNLDSRWQHNQIALPGLVRALSEDGIAQVAAGRAPGLERDLGGRSVLGNTRARNVVLLVLEGLAGTDIGYRGFDYIVDTGMPTLTDLADKGSFAQNLYTHGHQTIRGLYALLCGDYNKLSLDITKAAEYVQLAPEQRARCLPGALTEAGFHTSYLQAAPLAYMGKDVFMPAIGFADVRGEESLPRRYADVGWGPDDRAFLEQAAEHIVSLHENRQPFFSTLLTVGTHHPYTLPDEVRGADPKQDAAIYLDTALQPFWDSLEAAGVWEDTLLVISSDESRFASEHPGLGGNSGLWIARGPGVPVERFPGIYGLVDVPISVLDYLELTARYPDFGGRSLFRRYDNPRPLLFRSNRFYAANEAGQLLYCDTKSACFTASEFDGRQISSGSVQALNKEASAALYQQLQTWRQQADSSLRMPSQTRRLILLENTPMPVRSGQLNILAAGRYMQLPAQQQIILKLDASYRGSDSILLKPEVLDSEANSELFPRPELPPLHNGKGLRLEYRFNVEQDVTAAHPMLAGAMDSGTGTLTVRQFSLELGGAMGAAAAGISTLERYTVSGSIGHAGGRWQGRDYTNSDQAISGNAARFPLMELDLSLSSDGRLVCLHGWKLGYQVLFREKIDAPLSYKEFAEKSRAKWDELNFLPCTEDSLPALLASHSGLRMVIDSWSDSTRIMQRLQEVIPGARDRLIPQAYSPDQVEQFREMGYRDVIWTLYRYPERENIEQVMAQASRVKPWAVTLPLELAGGELIERLLEAGIRVYVHTVNDCATATDLWRRGANLYSDVLQTGDCQ